MMRFTIGDPGSSFAIKSNLFAEIGQLAFDGEPGAFHDAPGCGIPDRRYAHQGWQPSLVETEIDQKAERLGR